MTLGTTSTIVRCVHKSADAITADYERLWEVTCTLTAYVCDNTFPVFIALCEQQQYTINEVHDEIRRKVFEMLLVLWFSQPKSNV